MRIRKTLLLVSPLFLATILLFVKTTVGILNQGKSFDVLRFYFADNLEFSMAIGLILTEFAIALIIFSSETQQKLSGKWEVRFVPANWKGQTDPRVMGRGNMYLAKSPYSHTNFVGYMHVTYWDGTNTLLSKGFYEVRIGLRRKKATGQSLMIWGEGSGEEYVSGDPDTPYVRPCIYNLNYLADEQRLVGEAKMQESPTFSHFEAYRV